MQNVDTDSRQGNHATLSQTPFDITVRRDIDWDFSEVERLFVNHPSPLVTYLWASISMAATPLESFFIKTLQPTLESIENDEKLLQDVRDMIAQEALHSANHRKLNNKLKTLGYDVDGIQDFVAEVLHKMVSGMSPKDMMGVVSAGEHMLYGMAHVYLQSEKLRSQIHPQVDRLLLYHFIEEAEHGAVSHDQYNYFFGNDYMHRLKTAARARHVLRLIPRTIKLMAKSFPQKTTLKDRLGLQYYMWISPGPFRQMIKPTLQYLSPWYKLTFDHEDLEKMKKWDRELFSDKWNHAVSPI